MNLKYMKVLFLEISYKKKIYFFTIFKFFEMYLYVHKLHQIIILNVSI